MLKSKTRWIVRTSDQQKVETLENDIENYATCCFHAYQPWIDTVDSARYFLFEKDQFHDPFLFKEMGIAVDRIQQAIKNQDRRVSRRGGCSSSRN